MKIESLHPKRLWRRYVRYIQHSIVPKPYSHQVKMNIVVKKGQKSGKALIPCTIYAMDHLIDLNPALIRKATKEQLTLFDPEAKLRFVEDESIDTYVVKGTDVRYNPNNIAVEMTKTEEEEHYALNTVSLQEYERCPHCSQKVVLAEVEQTRYRSCPEIAVKLADPANADTVIPVQFGVNKSDITHWKTMTAIMVGLAMWGSAYVIFDHDYVILPFFQWLTDGIPTVNMSTSTGTSLAWTFKGLALSLIWLWVVPLAVYKNWKLGQWYESVKDKMTKTKYAT